MKTKCVLMAGLMFAFAVLAVQIAFSADEQKPKERYESKVLIEGKWGNKPGEYGCGGSEGEMIRPVHFTVDDRENVYVIDVINNRLQHYDSNGKFINAIPLRARVIGDDKEYEKTHYGYKTVPISMRRIFVKNGDVYVIQNEQIGKWQDNVAWRKNNLKRNLLKLEGNRFVKILSAEEKTKIETEATESEKLALLKELFKKDVKFKIFSELVGVSAEGGQSRDQIKQFASYDEIQIELLATNEQNNRWVRTVMLPSVLRKYASDGTLLAEIPQDGAWAISKSGNVYLLGLYSDKSGDFQELECHDYNGIRIRKLSLAK